MLEMRVVDRIWGVYDSGSGAPIQFFRSRRGARRFARVHGRARVLRVDIWDAAGKSYPALNWLPNDPIESTLYLTDERDTLKALRETLCLAQFGIASFLADESRYVAVQRLQRMIDEIDRQRPLGPNGKHGNRHTATCGCEDT